MVCPLGAGESGLKTSGKKPCNLVGEQQLHYYCLPQWLIKEGFFKICSMGVAPGPEKAGLEEWE